MFASIEDAGQLTTICVILSRSLHCNKQQMTFSAVYLCNDNGNDDDDGVFN